MHHFGQNSSNTTLRVTHASRQTFQNKTVEVVNSAGGLMQG